MGANSRASKAINPNKRRFCTRQFTSRSAIKKLPSLKERVGELRSPPRRLWYRLANAFSATFCTEGFARSSCPLRALRLLPAGATVAGWDILLPLE